MMVRNAFALADNIHMRAHAADCPSTADADSSSVHQHVDGVGDPHNENNLNVVEEGEDIAELQPRPMHSNWSNDESQDPTQHRGSSEDGDNSGDEGSASLRAENGDAETSSSENSREDPHDSSDDSFSEGEDLEELLGQIPDDRMGSNPEFDIAAHCPCTRAARCPCYVQPCS